MHVTNDSGSRSAAISFLLMKRSTKGIGWYRTSIDVPTSWAPRTGPVLDPSTVNDTFRVWVNGHVAPSTGLLSPQPDIGRLLHPGRNTIEVEVATSLINRLHTVTPPIHGIATPQDCGLLTSVRLRPYR